MLKFIKILSYNFVIASTKDSPNARSIQHDEIIISEMSDRESLTLSRSAPNFLTDSITSPDLKSILEKFNSCQDPELMASFLRTLRSLIRLRPNCLEQFILIAKKHLEFFQSPHALLIDTYLVDSLFKLGISKEEQDIVLEICQESMTSSFTYFRKGEFQQLFLYQLYVCDITYGIVKTQDFMQTKRTREALEIFLKILKDFPLTGILKNLKEIFEDELCGLNLLGGEQDDCNNPIHLIIEFEKRIKFIGENDINILRKIASGASNQDDLKSIDNLIISQYLGTSLETNIKQFAEMLCFFIEPNYSDSLDLISQICRAPFSSESVFIELEKINLTQIQNTYKESIRKNPEIIYIVSKIVNYENTRYKLYCLKAFLDIISSDKVVKDFKHFLSHLEGWINDANNKKLILDHVLYLVLFIIKSDMASSDCTYVVNNYTKLIHLYDQDLAENSDLVSRLILPDYLKVIKSIY